MYLLQLSPFPNSVKMPSRKSGLGGGNSQNVKKTNRACGAKSLISNAYDSTTCFFLFVEKEQSVT